MFSSVIEIIRQVNNVHSLAGMIENVYDFYGGLRAMPVYFSPDKVN
jgi:hypothetical protein